MINKSANYILSAILTSVFLMSTAFAEDANSRNTYAVVWTIDTEDSELFHSTVSEHSAEVLQLWRDGIVENVYIDADNKHGDVHKGDTGRVMFFIKADTDSEAKRILNETPLVKKNVAKYTLHPVGSLWLKQF
jgi:hypothetical protein